MYLWHTLAPPPPVSVGFMCEDAQWASEGIRFTGIFHSHPGKQEELSIADKAYIQRIMKFTPDAVNALHFPIVLPGKKMVGHIAEKVDGQVMVTQEQIIIEKE